MIIDHVKHEKPSASLTSWSTKKTKGTADSRGSDFFVKSVKEDMNDADGDWISADDAYVILRSEKKARKRAGDIRANMRRNNEVILNGVMPASRITPTG